MNFALLVLVISLFLLGGLVAAQAFYRRKSRLPMWRAFATLARERGLTVRECVTSPYGLPELYGRVSDRPIDIRTAEGKSAVPVRTVISVSHRIRMIGDVYFVRGATTAWTLGSPGWTQKWLGGSRMEDRIRFTGKERKEVDWLVRLAANGILDDFSRVVRADSFYAGAIRDTRIDVQLAGIQTDSGTIEAVVWDLVALAASLETRARRQDLRGTLTEVAPEKPLLGRRASDTGIMAFVLAMAAVLSILPLIGGGSLEAFALAWAMSGLLALLSISRIAASRLGPEEKGILAEFARHAA